MPEYEDIEPAPEPDEEPHEWWNRLEEAKGNVKELVDERLQEYQQAIEEFKEAHGGA